MRQLVKTIKQDNPKYKNFIQDYSEKSYSIYADKLDIDQEIECPRDPNMKVRKNLDGSISIIKKSFGRNIFQKKK